MTTFIIKSSFRVPAFYESMITIYNLIFPKDFKIIFERFVNRNIQRLQYFWIIFVYILLSYHMFVTLLTGKQHHNNSEKPHVLLSVACCWHLEPSLDSHHSWLNYFVFLVRMWFINVCNKNIPKKNKTKYIHKFLNYFKITIINIHFCTQYFNNKILNTW